MVNRMELKEIKTTKCPICGNSVVTKEEISWMHTNGHGNEIRRFSCGYEIEFVPNFMKEYPVKRTCCKNDPEPKILKNERMLTVERILKYIEKLKISEGNKSFKSDLISRIKSISC